MIKATVSIKIPRLNKFAASVTGDNPPAPIVQCLKRWAARYRGFAQQRFNAYSKGGGNWKALSPATIAGRMKRANATVNRKKAAAREKAREMNRAKGVRTIATGAVAILRNLGLLFQALNPTFNPQGGIETVERFSIIVGYGGPSRHGKSRLTIADIAAVHNQGSARIPQRKIIVPPSQQVISGMVADAEQALEELRRG